MRFAERQWKRHILTLCTSSNVHLRPHCVCLCENSQKDTFVRFLSSLVIGYSVYTICGEAVAKTRRNASDSTSTRIEKSCISFAKSGADMRHVCHAFTDQRLGLDAVLCYLQLNRSFARRFSSRLVPAHSDEEGPIDDINSELEAALASLVQSLVSIKSQLNDVRTLMHSTPTILFFQFLETTKFLHLAPTLDCLREMVI